MKQVSNIPKEAIEKNSVVYFIESENGLIKIGVTRDPIRRFFALQSMSPVRLRLLGVIKPERGVTGTAHYLEDKLHREFAEHWSHGEWFRAAREIKEYIRKNASEMCIETDVAGIWRE